MENYDMDKSIWHLRRKDPETIDSLMGKDPFFDEWFYQNNPHCLPLERLKEMCDEAFADIIQGNTRWNDWREDIVVRVICDNKFIRLRFGSFFFMEDCMYMLTKDINMEPYHNPYILGPKIMDLMDTLYAPTRYVVRVLFAGIYTGLNDEDSNRLFTGDVVHAMLIVDPDTLALKKDERAKMNGVSGKHVGTDVRGVIITMTANADSENGILLDNHFGLLKWSSWIRRIGTVYFDLDPHTTEVDSLEMAASFIRGDREMYIKAANTPSWL